ncbi:hypothetical protein B296_00050742 [Ensete ventricosum]|uniref:Uncharacterized protein n=1 Tax=Ensete ventricosum TaxID=4639 RepID=A0A426XPC0_ENSVE|nr:hypothetical protein B296_00050742 [Ensete ventricosum]
MLGQPRKHSEEHSLRRKLEPSNESEGSPIEAARRDAPVSLDPVDEPLGADLRRGARVGAPPPAFLSGTQRVPDDDTAYCDDEIELAPRAFDMEKMSTKASDM